MKRPVIKGWSKRVKIMHSHQCLILAVTTETGRLPIQRQASQLILAPDVNESGHVDLFVKPKRWTHVVTLFSHSWICCSHISGQSLYITQDGWNRKNFHRLTFHKWKFLLFMFTENTIMHFTCIGFLWSTKRSGMWPRECTFLVWQTKPHDSNHKHLVPQSTVTRISEFVV